MGPVNGNPWIWDLLSDLLARVPRHCNLASKEEPAEHRSFGRRTSCLAGVLLPRRVSILTSLLC